MTPKTPEIEKSRLIKDLGKRRRGDNVRDRGRVIEKEAILQVRGAGIKNRGRRRENNSQGRGKGIKNQGRIG